MTPPPTHLDPSELGNKDYWQKTYTSDLSTNTTIPTHQGTSWFSEHNATPTTLTYLLSLSPPLPPTTSILDLGTGTGELLFHILSSSPFTGRKLGIDYAPASIDLATRLARQKGYPEDAVRFQCWDILSQRDGSDWKDGEFDLVLDKGTFDAVSLNADVDAESGKRVCEVYRDRVMPMVKTGGRFLVTSCNWTEGELREWFEGGGGGDGEQHGRFEFEGRVEYPKFRFGGVEGQGVYGVCFRKVAVMGL
ncbi:MAG: hypothetical protein Q9182_004400 [Xanthomendoza sp. 2 TL-2023]